MNNDRHMYRVWDKLERRYVRHLLLGVDGLLYEIIDGKAVSVDQDRYEREQCTGQHDRNGKLIYEGDVVEVQYGESYKERSWVLWNEKENRLTRFSIYSYELLKQDYPNASHDRLLSETSYSNLRKEFCNRCEVVGNIREVKHA